MRVVYEGNRRDKEVVKLQAEPMQGKKYFYRATCSFVFNGADRNLYTIQEIFAEGIIGFADFLGRV